MGRTHPKGWEKRNKHNHALICSWTPGLSVMEVITGVQEALKVKVKKIVPVTVFGTSVLASKVKLVLENREMK